MNLRLFYGFAAVGGAIMLLDSCASEPINASDDRDEIYAKEFIKEFGVPMADHPWSQATQTTLTIVSPTPAEVKVYYKDNDQVFLTGDFTIPAGREEIPFIVPDNITELIIEANGAQYTAPVGSTLDLASSRSRGFASNVGFDSESKEFFTEYSEDEAKECAIRFTRDQLAKLYFDRFTPGQDNLDKLADNSVSIYGWVNYQTKNGSSPVVYMYPIYWSTKNSGYQAKDIKLYGGYDVRLYSMKEICLENDSWGNSQYEFDVISGDMPYASGTPTDFIYFPSATRLDNGDINSTNSEAYPLDCYNPTIQSQGIKFNGNIPPALNLHFGDNAYTSSNPYEQGYKAWKERFWNTSAINLWQSYAGMVFYMPTDENGKTKSVKFKVWRKQANGKYAWEERTRPAFFVGFSHPAPYGREYKGYTLGSDERPDFCDVVYFVATDDINTSIGSSYSISTISSEPYSNFTIAAEDLGGSHDWDFNDAVFNVNCVTKNTASAFQDRYGTFSSSGDLNWRRRRHAMTPRVTSNTNLKPAYVYEIEVTPQAAGGTMPIYVAYHGKVTDTFDKIINTDEKDTMFNDFVKRIADHYDDVNWTDGTWIIGTELHKWLRHNTTNQAINAGDKVTHKGRSVKFYSYAGIDSKYELGTDNTPLGQFSVIVDRDNSLGIDTSANFDPNGEDAVWNGYTKFDGVLGQGSYQIGAVSEDKSQVAPQMIRISGSWSWPKENTNIKLAYPKFIDWVNGTSDNASSWTYSSNTNADYTTKK